MLTSELGLSTWTHCCSNNTDDVDGGDEDECGCDGMWGRKRSCDGNWQTGENRNSPDSLCLLELVNLENNMNREIN